MQLNLSGHHVDVTPSLRRYVTTKLDRIERHFDHVTSAHVVLSVQKQAHTAEATLNVAGAQLVADSTASDMYAAIDLLADKLDRQVKRHKEKLNDHHQKGASHRAQNA